MVNIYIDERGMTPTIWAPEISAAVNVHNHINAAEWKDGVTLDSLQPQAE
jgi:hypothetical protein